MINSSRVQPHNRASDIMGACIYRGFQIPRRFADGDRSNVVMSRSPDGFPRWSAT
jgi:hypothetical protein